jgi:hypothetical protein
MRKINYFLIGLVMISASMSLVSAQATPPIIDVPIPQVRTWSLQDVYSWPNLLLNWFFWIIIVWTVWMVLRIAFDYVSSGGDPSKLKDMPKKGMNIAIGVALAILAKSVPAIIGAFVTGR